jgi:hypothetical protein
MALQSQGQTALDIARAENRTKCVAFLEQQLVNQAYMAASEGDIPKLRKLKAQGVDFSASDDINNTSPAVAAAASGEINTLYYLKNECGVDLSKPDQSGWTPATAAAQSGRIETFELRIETLEFLRANGVDVLARDRNRVSPLRIANQQFRNDGSTGLRDYLEGVKNERGFQPWIESSGAAKAVNDALAPVREFFENIGNTRAVGTALAEPAAGVQQPDLRDQRENSRG